MDDSPATPRTEDDRVAGSASEARRAEGAGDVASLARVLEESQRAPAPEPLFNRTAIALGLATLVIAIALGTTVIRDRSTATTKRAIATTEPTAIEAQPPPPAPTPKRVEQEAAPMITASHILVSWSGCARSTQTRTKAEARARIDEALAKIRAGAAFGAIAKAYGEDTTKDRGGDLGAFARNQMVKPFADAAFALRVGETSGVVETEFGYHLIQRTK